MTSYRSGVGGLCPPLFTLHRMHQMQAILTDVHGVCLSRGLNRRRRMQCTPRAVCTGHLVQPLSNDFDQVTKIHREYYKQPTNALKGVGNHVTHDPKNRPLKILIQHFDYRHITKKNISIQWQKLFCILAIYVPCEQIFSFFFQISPSNILDSSRNCMTDPR